MISIYHEKYGYPPGSSQLDNGYIVELSSLWMEDDFEGFFVNFDPILNQSRNISPTLTPYILSVS